MNCDVTIVTHAGRPLGSSDDAVLAASLAAIGASTRFAVWNDRDVEWRESPIAIIRSTWDYHLHPAAWCEWLEKASGETRLVNPPELLRWNTDKRYLLELHDRGVAAVPTRLFEHHNEVSELQREIAREGWTDIVVKPAIGASAFGARRFGASAHADAQAHAEGLAAAGAVLVQPFQDKVLTDRERSLVLLDGQFSHAFTKPAFDSGAAGRQTANTAYSPIVAESDLADAALSILPTTPTYARVDLVPGQSGPLLMELELIEPHLGLADHPPAALALAALLLQPPTR